MVLESAYFKPASVRRTSKKLGLKTEASTRFERGADIDAAPAAIERIAALLQQIGAAQPLGPDDRQVPVAARRRWCWSCARRASSACLACAVAGRGRAGAARAAGLLGVRSSRVRSTIRAIGHRTSLVAVTVPSFRVDVHREIDLIEEDRAARRLQGAAGDVPELTPAAAARPARRCGIGVLRQVLTACGFSEAMTFAFIEARRRSRSPAPMARSVARRVANPLSEKFAVLRPSLLPGLIDAAAHNRRRQHADVRLFETGTRFTARGETRAVGGWSGRERRAGALVGRPRVRRISST